MMRFIRTNAVFVLVVVIFIVAVFIGTIFLVWGRGSMSSSDGERSVAAWVGDEEVPYAEFVKAHDSRMEFYRRFYPNLSAMELESRFKVRKGALDAAIGRRLLLDEAKRLGLAASDEEVGRKVRETAAFQEGGGVFDPKKYREVLASSGLTPAQYEQEVRGEVLAQKVRAVVQEPVQVAEAEAFEEYRREKEKAKLQLLVFPPGVPAPGATVSAEAARRAYEADPAKYTLPERAQFACAAVLARDVPAPPAPDEAQLRAYYDANVAAFRTEKSVRARHILFRLAQDAAADEEKKVRDRAQFVLGKAKGGADFAALAREFSQDDSGPVGGDLGWFSAGQMVPEFEQAAFALAKGGVSDLVRTQYGLHIIKVEDVRAAGTPTFEEVRGEVARRVAAEAVRAAVSARVEEVNDALAEGEFDAVVARFGLPVQSTGLVTREGPIPGAAARPEVAASLFALGEGDVSEFLRSGEDFWVYKVVAKRAATVPSFEEAKPQVERELARADAQTRALGEARLRLQELARGEAPEALAARAKAEVRETAFVAQRDFVGEAGVKGELFQEAFGLAAGAWGGPVAAADGRIFLFKVVAKVPATRESFALDKGPVLERLRGEKRDAMFEAWLEELRRARAVKVNTQLVGAL